MKKIDSREIVVDNIMFSAKCAFMLNGNLNRHNGRYWSDSDSHWMLEGHTQYPIAYVII